MAYDPDKHHRRSIRLKGYDYSQAGAYFVTLVTQNRACLFGQVVNGEMRMNDAEKMLQSEWEAIPQRFPDMDVDECVVMPNHFHGILVIMDKNATVGATPRARPEDGQAPMGQPQAQTGQPQGIAPTLGEMIGALKSIVTVKYIDGVRQLNWEPFDRKLFLRNYFEHIIRNESDLDRIREYIINNPANWDSDDDNPKNTKP